MHAFPLHGSDGLLTTTTIYHNSLSLSFGDRVAGSEVAASSLTYKKLPKCVCVCLSLYKVHDASVSIWQRAEQEAARWGSVCAVLSSSPASHSLSLVLDSF